MRLQSLRKSSGLVALAAGLAALLLPSAAFAAPGDNNRGGWDRGGSDRDGSDRGGGERRGGGGEARGGGENRGGNWNRAQPQAQAPAPIPQPQAQPQPQARNWGGDRNGAEPGRGWGAQRPAEGQRSGRDWNNSGAVARPDPAFRNRAPDVQQPQPQPQPRADGNRAYSQRQQGWDGRQWQGQNWDRNNDRDRDGRADRWEQGRSGNWDRDRNWDRGANWDRNRSWNRGGDWNRDWRRDNRYNWQSYRAHNRGIYNLGRYYSPYNNWSYRRLNIGFHLQPLFFSQRYWISQPWQYRLPDADGPFRWVRYYDDALLVDVYSGEVVDVLHNFFW